MNKRMLFLFCWLAGAFAGLDGTLFTLMLPDAVTAISSATGQASIGKIGSWILTSFLLGWMVGGICLGWVADHFGRVKAMSAAIGLFALSTLLASCSSSVWQLALCRFFTGVGVGGTMVSIAVLLAEWWPGATRSRAIGLLLTSYQSGVFLAGVIGMMANNWREAFVWGGVPFLLSLASLLWIKEPHEWTKAVQSPQLRVFSRRNLWMGSLLFTGLLIGYWSCLSWVPTWAQGPPKGDWQGDVRSLLVTCNGIAGVIGCVLGGVLATSHRRRPLLGFVLAGAFIASQLLFNSHDKISFHLFWQYSLLGLFAGMGQSIIYLYLPELFSTKVRSTSVGICLNAGRIGAIGSALFLGELLGRLGGYAEVLFLFSFAYLVAMGTLFWARETLQVKRE
jgi:MFS family permease